MGDWVISIGNALSLKGSPTVTLGIVSALGRTVPTAEGTFYDMIQTDAAINTGSSGGPLVNLRGEVVGINQALLPRAQGMGFAQSASVAKRIVDSLLEHGRAMRPLIGLMGADVTPAIANELGLGVEQGVIVTHMSQTEPAYRAGIRVQDVITALDGVPTPDMASFLTLPPGLRRRRPRHGRLPPRKRGADRHVGARGAPLVALAKRVPDSVDVPGRVT